MPDREWYRHAYVDLFRRQIDLDPCMAAMLPLRELGIYAGIAINRPWRGRRFGERERNLLAILNCELAWFYERLVPTVASDPVTQLSPRLRQTLDGLLAGLSEKQLARQLGLSSHTVHDYVKALHKRLDVSNRAELIAKGNALANGKTDPSHRVADPSSEPSITKKPQ